jgi:hypothetical protein
MDSQDSQDKEFETFLRQFRLRRHAPVPALDPQQPDTRRYRWWIVAAAASVLALPLLFLVRNSAKAEPFVTVEFAGGGGPYTRGQKVPAGTVIRASGAEGMVLTLEDTSQVEMRAEAELSLERVEAGPRLRLLAGSILVTAARRPGEPTESGLSVETAHVVASVKGTVFLVETRPEATRVGVIAGGVEVQNGAAIAQLIPGDYVSSGLSVEEVPLAEAIAWSRNAATLTALLPQQNPVTPVGAAAGADGRRARFEAAAPPPESRPARSTRASAGQPQQQPPAPPPAAPTPPPPSTPGGQPQAPPKREGEPDAGKASNNGKQVFDRACVLCHAAAAPTYGSRGEYEAFISRKRAMGAPVTDSEVPLLVDFLLNSGRK